MLRKIDTNIPLNKSELLSVHGPQDWGPEDCDRHLTNQQIARAIQWVGNVAYTASNWLDKASRSNDTQEVANQVFDPLDYDHMNAQRERVAMSVRSGRRVQYLLGSLGGFMNPENGQTDSTRTDGFIKVEQQGRRFDSLHHTARTLSRAGVYACIHDLNVHPRAQGKGVATALTYAALSDQPKRLKVSLYTAQANEPMVNWATKYGFRETDTYDDAALVEGLVIPFARYEAPSVAGVLERIDASHPFFRLHR